MGKHTTPSLTPLCQPCHWSEGAAAALYAHADSEALQQHLLIEPPSSEGLACHPTPLSNQPARQRLASSGGGWGPQRAVATNAGASLLGQQQQQSAPSLLATLRQPAAAAGGAWCPPAASRSSWAAARSSCMQQTGSCAAGAAAGGDTAAAALCARLARRCAAGASRWCSSTTSSSSSRRRRFRSTRAPRRQHLADQQLIEKRAQLDAVDKLQPIAQELGCSLAQLALAWCAKNPHVSTVITGATRVEQVQENMKALAVLPKLTPEVLARIDSALAVQAEAKEAADAAAAKA